MSRQSVFVFAAALAAGLVGGCSRTEEAAQPVATPSVTLSRSAAAVGSPLDITYRFAVVQAAPPTDEEYMVFAHFLDADGERMWTDDHAPPTPVRNWKAGETVEYTRTLFIPKFPYVGTTEIQVGVYSPRSGQRLPLAGQDIGMRAYRVGSFDMALQSDALFVIFKDGWHEAELSEDSGAEWQWTRREGTIAFRNPKRDATLMLQVDQPVKALSEAQRVDVRLGAQTLDSFSLPAGVRELRRISLPATELGDDETVEMTIAVDKTFVPAGIPGLKSGDPRELGIRVFRAYVEPK